MTEAKGGWRGSMRNEDGYPTGTSAVRSGFLSNYKLSHGWRRSSDELTTGLAFPVNAAANQAHLHLHLFSSYHPLCVFLLLGVCLSFSFPLLRISLYLTICVQSLSSRCLIVVVIVSVLRRSFRRTVRDTALSLPVLERAHGRKEATVGASLPRICIRGIYNWLLFILCQTKRERAAPSFYPLARDVHPPSLALCPSSPEESGRIKHENLGKNSASGNRCS